jgi:hypothetical protein
MMDFTGKTAFVTGAANGIGLGICRALARNGTNIVLADIEQARLESPAANSRPSTSAPMPSKSMFPTPMPMNARPIRRRPNSAISISCSTMPVFRSARRRCGR